MMISNNIKMNIPRRSFLVWVLLSAAIIAFLSLYRPAVVVSGSMEPAIGSNDLIMIKLTGKVAEGDIAVYRSDKEIIAHRVIEVNDDTIITKGDANNVSDEPVDRDDIIGIVVGRPITIPIKAEKGILAKYLLESSGQSVGKVARWEVSALEEVPDTIEAIAGSEEYNESWYEFSVTSNSETTSEYELSIILNSENETALASNVTAGLFVKESDEWVMVGESEDGELMITEQLPIGHSKVMYRLGIKAADTEASGNYSADVNVRVTQVD